MRIYCWKSCAHRLPPPRELDIGWLVSCRENVRLAGIKFAFDAANNPVTLIGSHVAFERVNRELANSWTPNQSFANRFTKLAAVVASPLNGLNHYWLLAKLHLALRVREWFRPPQHGF